MESKGVLWLLLGLCSSAIGAVRELNEVQDAILLNKKEEVSVVGLFDGVRDAAARAAFEAAAGNFQKGIVFGAATADSIWARYEKKAADGPIALLFRDFDPATGKKKRGRKKPVELPLGSGPVAPDANAIARFVLAEALPDLLEMPEFGRQGVDASARSGAAMSLPLLPKMFLFHEGSTPLLERARAAGAALRPRVTVMSFDLTDSDADSPAATLKNTGFRPEDLGDDGLLLSLGPRWQDVQRYESGAGEEGGEGEGGLDLDAQPSTEDIVRFMERAIGTAGKGGGKAQKEKTTAEKVPAETPAAEKKEAKQAGAGGSVSSLDDASFDSTVLANDRVWVVLFTSSKSEDGRAFDKTWGKLQGGLRRMALGAVSVDEDGGRALAARLGVLDGGIPAVRLYRGRSGAGGDARVVMAGGEVQGVKKLRRAIKAAVEGLKLDTEGKFVKDGVAGEDPAAVIAKERKKAPKKPKKPKTAAAASKPKKSSNDPLPKADRYLLGDVHPGYFFDVQTTAVTKLVGTYRTLVAAEKAKADEKERKSWCLVLPVLRRRGAHSNEEIDFYALYDKAVLQKAFPDVVFATTKQYFTEFRPAVDANIFFLYDADGDVKAEDGCPDDSTDGSSPRFKLGYMSFKPKENVKDEKDNEMMFGGKKVKLGRHRCVNVVAGVGTDRVMGKNTRKERYDACGEDFAALLAHEQTSETRTLALTGFHNIDTCRSSDALLYPPAGVAKPYTLVPAIAEEANKFVRKNFGEDAYIAVHLERADDDYREKHAELYFSEDEIVAALFALGKEQGIWNFFLATTEKNEVIYLRKKLQREVEDEDNGLCATDGTCPALQVLTYKRRPSTGFKGLHVSYVEKHIAEGAATFVAAKESETSKAIYEARTEAQPERPTDRLLAEGAELAHICDAEMKPKGCKFI